MERSLFQGRMRFLTPLAPAGFDAFLFFFCFFFFFPSLDFIPPSIRRVATGLCPALFTSFLSGFCPVYCVSFDFPSLHSTSFGMGLRPFASAYWSFLRARMG